MSCRSAVINREADIYPYNLNKLKQRDLTHYDKLNLRKKKVLHAFSNPSPPAIFFKRNLNLVHETTLVINNVVS